MREILFRGQTDKGEWVEGESINTQYDMNGKKHIYIGVLFSSEQTPLMQNVEWHEIIPETIGQYTGLADENGKKIFESDIHCNENNNKKFVVKLGHFYDEELLDDMYGWYMEDNWGNRFGLNGSEYEYANIIGNTIDNPKLMGE